jgi:ADP-heptose:LPS heptosyltransferase/GT2 family glycosyltransferase
MITVSIIAGTNPLNIERCLKSLKHASLNSPLDIWVIDNKVDYDVKQIIDKHYPTAHLIKNEKIKGFGENHNQVLRQLATKYALILNDDVILDEKCIAKMYQFMEDNPRVALTGPSLFEDSWDTLPQTCGGLLKTFLPTPIKVLFVTLTQLLGAYHLVQKYIGHRTKTVENPLPLSYVSGACMMIRQEALKSVGLFDERFYMYFEDVDMGKRILEHNWLCYQVSDAKTIHVQFGSLSAHTYNYITKSAQYYTQKYHGLFIKIIVYFLSSLLRLISALSMTKRINPPSLSASSKKNLTIYPKNILILKLGGIGDTLLILPAVKALKNKFPLARLTLFVEKPGAEIIRNTPYIDEIVSFTEFYTYRSYTKLFRLSFFREGYNLIKFLSKRHFDIFIAFQNLYRWDSIFKPLFIGYLSRARYRLGLNSYNRGFFLTHKVPDTPGVFKHHIQRYLEVVQLLGANSSSSLPEIFIPHSDSDFARNFLKKNEIKSSDLFIGIHAGSNLLLHLRNSWSKERFIGVANDLISSYNAKILLTAATEESDLVNYIAEHLIKPPVICKGVTIKQLAAVISHCRLFISNDTGPMHIAVAMKVPTIGIFGPGDSLSFGSYPPETNFVMVNKLIDCSPCWNLKCTSRICLNTIMVKDVLEPAKRLLSYKNSELMTSK